MTLGDKEINTPAEIFRKARGLNFDLSFLLHPYFMHASSEDSGESAHFSLLNNVISTKVSCMVHLGNYLFIS